MSGYFVDAMILGSIYALFTVGLSLSWGILGVLNLAHGSIFMAGALSAYMITSAGALPLAVVLPASMLVSGGLVVLMELVAFRPIRRRAANPLAAELPMAIASVGVSSVLVAFANNFTAGYSLSLPQDMFTVSSINILGLTITNIGALIVVFAIGLTVALGLYVARSRQGRALKVIAQDSYVGGLLGISMNRLALGTMFISGALAGCGGVLFSIHVNSMHAYMGEALLLKAFAVIVVGGIGSIWGAAIGAYVLAAAEVLAVVSVGVGMRDVVAFVLIIVILLARPQGLLSKRKWQRS
ncbi:branched-chain amino acid ABC transporter permease [Agrococcus baldri]|uniref:Branched-chain amino acid ABC transporter permease n=1 Tax=Agrococcus baldri TaxID=153730 RepID=A0AA87R9Q4_9MICO|nr:branched-chain amino acid ABC transporter permease [Agrococcus baldri]GEK79115.1 branched-chain amino acid ABC transporter permease [Agrococcus baldri]